jgi:diguanylate cyclase (GGDEF)-like protein
MDIDHFKSIDDTHGHLVGDRVLRDVARVIEEQIRKSDIAVRMDGEPFAARYGGEEFVIILPETDLVGAAAAAQRIRSIVEETDISGGETQPSGKLTLSIGVASLKASDASPREVLARADKALHLAKESGRNRVEVLDEE